MKLLKRLLCLYLVLCLMVTHTWAQGINWATGLSLEQIKQKAKAENKFIFLDCFTTWCAPCKMMDAQVYGNDSVGSYLNSRFISVKVQMDKTGKDNEQVRAWYGEAGAISEQYHVNAYPTFIFLSPEAKMVERQMGFKEVEDFIGMAKDAIVPGRAFYDPYTEYNRFIAEYKDGKRDYDRYPAMIIVANRLNENDFFNQLLKELSFHVSTLPRNKRYNKETIEMWNGFTFPSKHSVFRFFYRDGKLIDRVMNQRGYASRFIDKTIQNEIVDTFFREQNKNKSIAMSGMYLSGKGLPSDSSEADWKKLEKQIREKYNSSYAKRNVLKARMEWYNRHRHWSAYAKSALVLLNRYHSMDNVGGPWQLNNIAWVAFSYSTERSVIDDYIKWMQKVVAKIPEFVPALDTYANLLHKAGRTEEAIQWETKAMNLVDDKSKKEYKDIIEQMKRGEPTYGAVWLNKK